MSRRNLLVCFDAFGTLFSPKPSVADQYTAIARKSGLTNLTTSQVKSSFDKAISNQLRLHPNYGKASGMGAERWWTNVINETFLPLTPTKQSIPPELAPKLLHRFSSSKGYKPADADLPKLFSQLKGRIHNGLFNAPLFAYDNILIGVITNSDDRVPDILSDFGLEVSPLRFESPLVDEDAIELASTGDHQIDFVCLSYDVGSGKPSPNIFDAAEELANEVVETVSERYLRCPGRWEPGTPWTKVYVGDEFEKDVVGAIGAGWNSVYVGPEEGIPTGIKEGLKPRALGEQPAGVVLTSSDNVGVSPVSLRANSVREFIRWLIR